MCAIVPWTPVVLTLPDTAPSSATVKLPEPEPGTESAGTCSAPVSFTFTVLPLDIMPAQADSASDTRTTNSFFMGASSFWGFVGEHA